MLRPKSVASLGKKCKTAGINVAVDTAGAVPWDYFENVLPFADLFLYDVKTLDPIKHKNYVGADNALILENLIGLLDRGANVIVRVPIIPDVNDEKDIAAIRDFLSPYPDCRIELLPYYRLGENKYAALGLTPHIFDVPSEEKTAALRAVTERKR